MAFLDFLTDNPLGRAIFNQKEVTQGNIPTTASGLNEAYGLAQSQLPNFNAYNLALQPMVTGYQLGAENQTFGPSANLLQRGYFDKLFNNLNRDGLDPALQDLVATNIAQTNAASGAGFSDFGKMFGRRSLIGAGINEDQRNIENALRGIGQLASTGLQYQPQGLQDVGQIFNALSSENAARQNLANKQAAETAQNERELYATGGRILGTVAGGIIGAKTGDPVGGAAAGGAIGGGIFGGGQQQQQGGGNPEFTSILSGLSALFSGQGRFGAGSGMQYQGPRGNVLTSTKAYPIASPYG